MVWTCVRLAWQELAIQQVLGYLEQTVKMVLVLSAMVKRLTVVWHWQLWVHTYHVESQGPARCALGRGKLWLGSTAYSGDAADALQALRALRLLRIVKLARSWTNLQDILRKTALSLVDIFYFTILLLLFMFIFSLLGMELFANYCRFTPEGDLI